MLVLREGVVVVHRPVPAPGLQDAVVDAGIDHLGDHELGWRFDLLHADRHVLDEVVVALEGELQLPVASDTEGDVGEPAPGVVTRPEEHFGLDFRPIPHAKRLRGGACDDLLQVFEVDLDARVAARVLPVLEHMRMTVDDHRCSLGS